MPIPPPSYLDDIITQYGGYPTGKMKLIDIMQSHCINSDAVDALLRDDYETFISERKKSVITEFKTTGFVQNLIDYAYKSYELRKSDFECYLGSGHADNPEFDIPAFL